MGGFPSFSLRFYLKNCQNRLKIKILHLFFRPIDPKLAFLRSIFWIGLLQVTSASLYKCAYYYLWVVFLAAMLAFKGFPYLISNSIWRDL